MGDYILGLALNHYSGRKDSRGDYCELENSSEQWGYENKAGHQYQSASDRTSEPLVDNQQKHE